MSQFVEVLAKIDTGGGTITVLDGQVRLRVRPGLLDDQDREVLTRHKPDILSMLTGADVDTITPHSGKTAIVSTSAVEPDQERADQEPEAVDDLVAWLKENTVEPIPCDKCGGLDLWQDLTERWRCVKCSPPILAKRVRERAARIKERNQTRRRT